MVAIFCPKLYLTVDKLAVFLLSPSRHVNCCGNSWCSLHSRSAYDELPAAADRRFERKLIKFGEIYAEFFITQNTFLLHEIHLIQSYTFYKKLSCTWFGLHCIKLFTYLLVWSILLQEPLICINWYNDMLLFTILFQYPSHYFLIF